MGHFKTFMLGVGVAFGIYCLTRKGDDGRSILDETLDNPSDVANKAKNYAKEEAVETLKEIMS